MSFGIRCSQGILEAALGELWVPFGNWPFGDTWGSFRWLFGVSGAVVWIPWGAIGSPWWLLRLPWAVVWLSSHSGGGLSENPGNFRRHLGSTWGRCLMICRYIFWACFMLYVRFDLASTWTSILLLLFNIYIDICTFIFIIIIFCWKCFQLRDNCCTPRPVCKCQPNRRVGGCENNKMWSNIALQT